MISKHHFDRMCGLIDNRNGSATIAYGGGCINDAVIHVATNHMGFTGETPLGYKAK